MNQHSLQQAAQRLLAGLLTLGVVAGSAFVAPRAAFAEPEAPGAGPNVYMPTAQKEACTTIKSPGIGGFQVYGGTSFGSPYYKDLMDSGASWVRQVFAWNVLEPQNTTPANYAWETIDPSVQLAAQHCWTIILTNEHNPKWAATLPEGPIDKVPLSEMAEMMAAVVERYDGDGKDDAPGSPKVMYFEMYNEPDAGQSGANGRWGFHGDQYAAMLKAVYPAIKAANPQAQVVFAGVAHDFFTDSPSPGPFIRRFLDDVFKNGAGPYFDIMNFHFYPLFGWNWTKNFPKDGPGLVEKTESIRAIMRKYNIDKPIIITEAAWHNNGNSPYGSNTVQTRLLVQMYTQAKAANVPMVAWWPLADPGGSYPLNSGLVTEVSSGPVTRKSAYTAYQVFMRELGSAKYVGEIAAGEDVKVYQLRDEARSRTVFVAWTNPTDLATVWGSPTVPYKDTTRTTTVAVSGGSATVYDPRWTEVARVADGDDGRRDGKVTVTINGDPKYIVIGG